MMVGGEIFGVGDPDLGERNDARLAHNCIYDLLHEVSQGKPLNTL